MQRTIALLRNLQRVSVLAASGQSRQRQWAEEFVALNVEINKQLERYASVPILMFSPLGRVAFGTESPNRRDEIELGAAESIMNLARWGAIGAVGQCVCNRWFRKLRKSQKSCSPGCRHKLYEQTDACKARRRAYMRDYYKLKTSGKVK